MALAIISFMSWMRRLLHRPVLLGVAGALCLWVLLFFIRGSAIPDLCSLDFNGSIQPNRCTVGFNVRTDWYSIVDPVSISPLQRASWERQYLQTGAMPRWQGIAWLPGEIDHHTDEYNLVDAFSWLSFGLFALVTLGTVGILSLFPPSVGLRAVQVGLLTWYMLEAVRWLIVLLWFSVNFTYDNFILDQDALRVMLSVIVPCLVSFLWFRRRLKAAYTAEASSVE